MFILLEGINSNNGSIIIDPNTTDFISTLYPYQIFVDDTVFVINNEDDWDLDGDGVDQYVIPNLEAGTAYSLLMIDGNGCGYSNNGEYYEIGFNSYLDVDIVGFCPECQESNNGGFAYILSPIEDEVASGLNPDWVLTEQGPAMNSELDIIYTNNNYDLPACLGDIDGDGINNTEDLDIDGDGTDDLTWEEVQKNIICNRPAELHKLIKDNRNEFQEKRKEASKYLKWMEEGRHDICKKISASMSGNRRLIKYYSCVREEMIERQKNFLSNKTSR